MMSHLLYLTRRSDAMSAERIFYMNRDNIRQEINSQPLYNFYALRMSPKGGRNHYVCPICGSGSGPKGTGALHVNPNTYRVTCFSGNCFGEKGEDTLGALEKLWGLSETAVMERCGYTIDKGDQDLTPLSRQSSQKPAADPEPDKDYLENGFYRQAYQQLQESSEALEYLARRGISRESIERFKLGFVPAWTHPKNAGKYPAPRIIIPRSRRTYQTRRIDGKDAYKNQLCGSMLDLFNVKCLESAKVAFIAEGELDAISVMQIADTEDERLHDGAIHCIGLGSTSNTGTLLEAAKWHRDIVYILALDNDLKEDGTSHGKAAQDTLAAKMETEGIRYINYDPGMIYGEFKDANDAYNADREAFSDKIRMLNRMALDEWEDLQTELEAKREAEDEERRQRTGPGMVDLFLKEIETESYKPIPTGIKDIDRAMDGGFLKKTFVTIGAAPGMGKTALAQFLLENIAKNRDLNRDILFINLEMSREQLLGRSLSRYMWNMFGEDVSTLDVLRGYTWSEQRREHIHKAAAAYSEEVARRFIYNPPGVSASLDSILKAMEAEAARTQSEGREAPIVCIDYLHLIQGDPRDDEVLTLKKAVDRLKGYAIKHDTVVLAILANNRQSNKTGTADLESGRDTSAIEYSSDQHLGLTYAAILDHERDEAGDEYTIDKIRELRRNAFNKGAPIPIVCRRLVLSINKNRFNAGDASTRLVFDGRHSMFYQEKYDEIPIEDEDNPFSR